MHLVSINTALPPDIAGQGKTVRTSIFKQPVAGPVQVLADHLAGDGQRFAYPAFADAGRL